MALTAQPLTDNVYARIRALILANKLRSGQKLVDRDLANLLGASRTPIREALARLAMTGLVEARTRRGYYVAQYASEQMSELYEFRKILEVAAAGMAAQNATPTHLRKIERILLKLEKLIKSPKSPAKTVAIDLEIHDVVAQASGNGLLVQTIRDLMDKVVTFIWVDWAHVLLAATPEQVATAQREHKLILCSILEKDAEGAASAMSAHIDKARQGLEEVLRARADMQNDVLFAKHKSRGTKITKRVRRT